MGLFEIFSNASAFELSIRVLIGVPEFTYFLGVFRYIPNSRIGVVEKLWSMSGRALMLFLKS